MTSQDPFYFFIYVLLPEVVFLVTFQSQHEQVLEGARCPVFKKISNVYFNLPALHPFSPIHSPEVPEGLPILDFALTKPSSAIRLDCAENST